MRNQKRSESTEQTRVMNWARRNEYRCPELALLHHIPNGGSRNKIEAANLKAQGVKSGVPDLCLPVPKGEFHGFYIEMKFGKNKPSEKQRWWLEKLEEKGYMTAVCWSATEAMDAIATYLGIAVTAPLGMESERIDMVCQICEKKIPIGKVICENCMFKSQLPEELKEEAEQLEDIAGVLAITAGTDANIQNAMESILRISERLKRRSKSGIQTKDCKSKTSHGRKDV